MCCCCCCCMPCSSSPPSMHEGVQLYAWHSCLLYMHNLHHYPLPLTQPHEQHYSCVHTFLLQNLHQEWIAILSMWQIAKHLTKQLTICKGIKLYHQL
jgi:hypothetical protein